MTLSKKSILLKQIFDPERKNRQTFLSIQTCYFCTSNSNQGFFGVIFTGISVKFQLIKMSNLSILHNCWLFTWQYICNPNYALSACFIFKGELEKLNNSIFYKNVAKSINKKFMNNLKILKKILRFLWIFLTWAFN